MLEPILVDPYCCAWVSQEQRVNETPTNTVWNGIEGLSKMKYCRWASDVRVGQTRSAPKALSPAAPSARLSSSPHLLASLVARCAVAREESRGGHFREDFPAENPALDGLHTVVRPGREPELERWS